jgi:cytoskeletal protein RodZ
MTQESFGAELKKERETREISLQDISAATRVNVRFLEAIEEGKFGVLPAAYIRAFVREYAETVGLDPVETLARLEAVRGPEEKPPLVSQTETDRPEGPSGGSWLGDSMVKFQDLLSLQNVVLAVLAIVAIVLIISMVRWGAEGSTSEGVSEIPFDKVVEESEATAEKASGAPALPGVMPARHDSLTLEIQTRDSVWMSLVVDDLDTSQYLFGPDRARSWMAKDRFVLTVGNPTGATFQLNGVPLGSLAGPDGRVRNRELTVADLQGR